MHGSPGGWSWCGGRVARRSGAWEGHADLTVPTRTVARRRAVVASGAWSDRCPRRRHAAPRVPGCCHSGVLPDSGKANAPYVRVCHQRHHWPGRIGGAGPHSRCCGSVQLKIEEAGLRRAPAPSGTGVEARPQGQPRRYVLSAARRAQPQGPVLGSEGTSPLRGACGRVAVQHNRSGPWPSERPPRAGRGCGGPNRACAHSRAEWVEDPTTEWRSQQRV